MMIVGPGLFQVADLVLMPFFHPVKKRFQAFGGLLLSERIGIDMSRLGIG